jgi:hypothetical protein
MYRKLIASLFYALGLLVCSAFGQQPAGNPTKEKKADDPSTTTKAQSGPTGKSLGKGGSGGTKKADASDALIQAALAHDPDMKMAQAKVQLAEAELAKAKQTVVLKVLTLNATIQELTTQVSVLTQNLHVAESGYAAKSIALSELTEARMKLEHSKNALARAEMELKLLTGGVQKDGNANAAGNFEPSLRTDVWGLTSHWNSWPTPFGPNSNNPYYQNAPSYWTTPYKVDQLVNPYTGTSESQTTKGPIPDRIRTALDKSVKLGQKGEQVTFAKALEIFKKDAGLDVPVRTQGTQLQITSEGEELPVGAWFQLFIDNNGVAIHVREYGLLVTSKDAAPQGAISVIDFWKRPIKKETESAPKAEIDPSQKK